MNLVMWIPEEHKEAAKYSDNRHDGEECFVTISISSRSSFKTLNIIGKPAKMYLA